MNNQESGNISQDNPKEKCDNTLVLRGRGNQGSPSRVGEGSGEGSKTQHDALHRAFRQNSREPVRNISYLTWGMQR